MSTRRARCVVLVAVLAVSAACNRDNGNEVAADKPAAGDPKAETYPAPRWPSYFKPAESVEDLMPAARALARNTSGFQGKGMGILQSGDSVLIVSSPEADPMVIDAIKRALAERKVKLHLKYGYELQGQTKEQYQARRAERAGQQRGRRIEDAGIYQASGWISGQFPDPSVPKAWLKQRRPDVYAELFPDEATGGTPAPVDPETGLPLPQPQAQRDRSGPTVGDGIKSYLTAHPEIRGVFWRGGGTTGLRRALYPMQDKYLGTFITDNIYNLQSQMTTYPGDVWQLAEEQLLEPLAYAERLEITDPEGTNLWSDLTQDMAERWSQGAYQRGHLYMFPNQATGRFGYSFVNYPGFQQKWLARDPIALIHGTLAGTQGHGGFFPRWEITFKDGFISDVKGGGAPTSAAPVCGKAGGK